MAFPNLPLTNLQIRGEPHPHRALKFDCHINNPTRVSICILDAWVTVVDAHNIVLADGKIFQQMHNAVDPAVIAPGERGIGVFHIELSSEALRRLEELRAGGDVTLLFYSRVLVSAVEQSHNLPVLQPPFETQFGADNSGRFEHRIPQSEWIKLLKALAWSELEIIEMPLGRLRSSQLLARAVSRFEDAQRNYRVGNWDETMQSCRKAFEAVVHDASGEIGMGKALKVFESIMGEGDKTKCIDDLVKAFGKFLHLGRHDNPEVKISRADAELALWLTGSFLSYLGQQ